VHEPLLRAVVEIAHDVPAGSIARGDVDIKRAIIADRYAWFADGFFPDFYNTDVLAPTGSAKPRCGPASRWPRDPGRTRRTPAWTRG